MLSIAVILSDKNFIIASMLYLLDEGFRLNAKEFSLPTDQLTHCSSFSKRKKRLFESQQVKWSDYCLNVSYYCLNDNSKCSDYCVIIVLLSDGWKVVMLQCLHCWAGAGESLLLCVTEGLGPCRMVPESQQQVGGDLVKAHKLPNPIIASQQHRALHQELLLCYRWWVNMQLCSRSKWKVHANAFTRLQLCHPETCQSVQFVKVVV